MTEIQRCICEIDRFTNLCNCFFIDSISSALSSELDFNLYLKVVLSKLDIDHIISTYKYTNCSDHFRLSTHMETQNSLYILVLCIQLQVE